MVSVFRCGVYSGWRYLKEILAEKLGCHPKRGAFLSNQTAQPRVKLTRLRLRVCGAIFGQFFLGKIGLRSQNRRAAYAIVSAPLFKSTKYKQLVYIVCQ